MVANENITLIRHFILYSEIMQISYLLRLSKICLAVFKAGKLGNCVAKASTNSPYTFKTCFGSGLLFGFIL